MHEKTRSTDGTEPDRSLRLARADDTGAIDALMKASIRDIFPRFYDERQTASSIAHVAVPDEMLIDDGTYFVIEEGSAGIVACGGWSRRDKLYTGSGAGADDARPLDPASEPARIRAMFVRSDRARRGLGTWILEACESSARNEGFTTLALLATLPGVQLYHHFGFRPTGDYLDVRLPDGVHLRCLPMEKPVSSPS